MGVAVGVHGVVVVVPGAGDEPIEDLAEVAVGARLELDRRDPHRRVRCEHDARARLDAAAGYSVAHDRGQVDDVVVTLRGQGEGLGLDGHGEIIGTGTTEALVRADGLLDAFYQTVFRAVLERHRSHDGAPPPDPPPELVRFAHFKPAKAVGQPQVRKALRALLEDDAELPALVAHKHPRAKVGDCDAAAVVAAAHVGDRSLLEHIACCAAATRPNGWEGVLDACVAAAAGLAAGHAAGEAAGERQADAAQRRVEAASAKVETQRRELERRSADLARVRAQRDEARSAIDEHERTSDGMRGRVDTVRAELGELRLERDALAERVQHLESVLRGQEGTSHDLELSLRARIDDLESALVPDLEPHAVALERLADELRETVRRLTSGEGTERVRRRRPPEIPKGIMPDSPAAATWALAAAGLVMVVDGYNVTKQSERGWSGKSLEDQRRLLISRCCQVRRAGGAEVRIVFDSSEANAPGSRRRLPEGVSVEFSGGPIADDAIVDIVGSLDLDVAAVVVTSDRELQRRVAALGAAPLPSPSFLEAIDAPRR